MTPAATKSTELVTLQDYSNAGGFNVLAPAVIEITGEAQSEVLVQSISVVKINPGEDAGEIYHDFRYANSKDGKAALSSLGLTKIATAAGIKWIPELCKVEVRERRPDGHVYVRYVAGAGVRQPNGEWHIETASKAIDTADVAEQIDDADRRTFERTFGRQNAPSWVKALKKDAEHDGTLERAIEQRVKQQIMQIREHIESHAECVPTTAEILTWRGWRRHDEVLIGEPVLAYDVETDTTRWVPLQEITVYPSAPTVSVTSRGFRVRCTPDHSWAIEDHWGIGARKRRRALAQTVELTRSLRHVVLAAPAPGGDSPLSEQQAALLGWIATDGTIRYVDVGRWGPYPRVTIVQSKHYLDEIRALLPEGSYSEYTHPPKDRTFPSGRTYATKAAVQIQLRTGLVKELLGTAGIKDKGDLPGLIARLSHPARVAMLDAMLKGDGTQLPGGQWVFGQKPGPVLDAFQLLATLEGRALGVTRQSKVVVEQSVRDRRHVNGPNLRIEDAGREAVWCPTTPLGTWVMRLDGQVTITGNTKAKSRVIRRILALKQTYTNQELERPFAVPRLLYRPDLADPLAIEQVQMEGRQATEALFGASPTTQGHVAGALPAAAPPPSDPASPVPERAKAGSTSSGAETRPRGTSEPVDVAGDTSSKGAGSEADAEVRGPASAGKGPAPDDGQTDLEKRWVRLIELCGDDPAKARRTVTKANKRTNPVTSRNDAQVTSEELDKAIAFIEQQQLPV